MSLCFIKIHFVNINSQWKLPLPRHTPRPQFWLLLQVSVRGGLDRSVLWCGHWRVPEWPLPQPIRLLQQRELLWVCLSRRQPSLRVWALPDCHHRPGRGSTDHPDWYRDIPIQTEEEVRASTEQCWISTKECWKLIMFSISKVFWVFMLVYLWFTGTL